MRPLLGVISVLSVLATGAAALAQDLSYEVRGKLAQANLASKDGSTLLYWVTAFRGNTNVPAAFDTKYSLVLRPQYLSGTHVNGSRVFLGMDGKGTLIGGLTPFGADVCSTEAINRKVALLAYFGGKEKAIKLGALERLQFTPEGKKTETVCYYPFSLTSAQIDQNFAGLADKDIVWFKVLVDGKTSHTVWSGTEFTPFQRGSAKTSLTLSVKQYKGYRAVLPLLPQ